MTSENWNLADYYQGKSCDEKAEATEQDGQQPTLPCFPTGQGQSDTHARTLNDGRQNPHLSAGKPYTTVTGKGIAKLVANPQSVPKERGQWFIPSTYADADARAHDAQREKGAFRWLTLDVDENDLDLSDIDAALSEVIGDARRIIYSSRGATEANKKWRALVPIKGDLAGAEFTDTQNALFDLLEEASDGALIPDRALSRPAQLVYLPNRGEFYQHHIHKGVGLLELTPDSAIIAHRDKVATEKAKAAQDAQEARERRAAQRKANAQGDDASPMDHFNAAYTVADLLDRYGYTQAGSSNDWKSPFQSSGSYATRDFGEFWISLSGSDAAQEIGAETKDGHRYGDAFDLFCHFEHGGDFKAAVRAYAQEAGLYSLERATSATGQHSGAQSQEQEAPQSATIIKPTAPFQFTRVSELKYRAPEYIIGDLFETDTLGLIFGDPGCGKSFLAVDVALSVATGTPFHGRGAKQGSVFFIAGEGHNGLARRFAAWSQARGVPLADAPLFKSERAAQFLDGASAKAVADAVGDLAGQHGSPALIIIDTLARNFGAGDENNTKDMSEFVVAIDDLKSRFPGCSVLIVHHSGHAEKQRARGAMALKGALDCEYRVEKDGHNMRLINTKMKDAEPPQDVYFSFKQVELDEEAKSAVLEASAPPERQVRLTTAQRLAQNTYVSAAAKAGVWEGGAFLGVELEDWRLDFYAKHTGDSKDTKRQAFSRVRRTLADADIIAVQDDRYLWRDSGVQMTIMLQRDKRDEALQSENCHTAEAVDSVTSVTNA